MILVICLFIFVSVLHLNAIFWKWGRIQRISKVFILPLLMVLYFLLTENFLLTVLLAGISGWLGDAFLIKIDKTLFFRIGLVCFLACHIFYIPSMLHFIDAVNMPVLIASIVIAIPVCILLIRCIKPSKEMFFPVLCYAIVIELMSITALQFMLRRSFVSHSFSIGIAVFAGSCLFLISDTILAFYTFRDKPKQADFPAMLSYIIAQTCIVTGLGMC